ncbi:restriction endonuclease [Streptomyces sp. NPDC021056]|uniref:restriction endonuclease n=1 Tax=Streptomyces sp. NPDC021056 TaxID=3155012 RepID=UPI0033DFFFB7
MGDVMYLRMPFSNDDADNWRSFERLVADQVGRLDPNVNVEHDVKLKGVHSQIERQIDVLASAPAIGSTVRIAFECKLYKRSVSIGTVEEFIGKLQDLRVDRGVLCVFGGVTPAAFRRLAGVLHPRIDLYIWHRDKPTYLDWENACDVDNLGVDAEADWDRRMAQVRSRWFHYSMPSSRL